MSRPIVQTIRKLLAAERDSRGPEAANAGRLARELMERHRVHVAIEDAVAFSPEPGARETWQRQLLSHIARAHDCRSFLNKKTRTTGIGGHAADVRATHRAYRVAVRDAILQCWAAWSAFEKTLSPTVDRPDLSDPDDMFGGLLGGYPDLREKLLDALGGARRSRGVQPKRLPPEVAVAWCRIYLASVADEAGRRLAANKRQTAVEREAEARVDLDAQKADILGTKQQISEDVRRLAELIGVDAAREVVERAKESGRKARVRLSLKRVRQLAANSAAFPPPPPPEPPPPPPEPDRFNYLDLDFDIDNCWRR